MNYETYIFDLDGTLLNTVGDLTNAVNHTLLKNGFPAVDKETVRFKTGRGLRNLLLGCLGSEVSGFDSMFSYFKSYYESHSCIETCPYNGIPEVLEMLKLSGKNVGIVSNKSDIAVKDLCNHFFKGIPAMGEKDNVPKKPSPEMVWNMIDFLGGQRENSVYVGDSEVDFQTAQNSNLDLIACSWGFRPRKLLEELGCKSIADVPKDVLRF